MAFRKKDPAEKLAELKEQEEALRAKFDDRLKAKRAEIRATQAKQRKEEEKARTHINIIVGAAVQKHAEQDPDFHRILWDVLDKAVTRKDQRETLDLKPKE